MFPLSGLGAFAFLLLVYVGIVVASAIAAAVVVFLDWFGILGSAIEHAGAAGGFVLFPILFLALIALTLMLMGWTFHGLLMLVWMPLRVRVGRVRWPIVDMAASGFLAWWCMEAAWASDPATFLPTTHISIASTIIGTAAGYFLFRIARRRQWSIRNPTPPTQWRVPYGGVPPQQR